MTEQYYNNHCLIQESARARHAAESDGVELSFAAPDALGEVIRQEAFYCRASESEMPSRIVLHGISISTLAEAGAYLDFEVAQQSRSGGRRRLPFNYPVPVTPEYIRSTADKVRQASVAETEIRLDQVASGMLADQQARNGLSCTDNFIALAGLINFIGTSEREGLVFAIQTEQDSLV